MATFKADSMPLFVTHFLTDIAALPNEAVGIYIKLLCHQWASGELPGDNESLARMVSEPLKVFNKIWPKISKKFTENGNGGLYNEKLESVREERDEFKAKVSEGGRLGAQRRWNKDSLPNSQAIAKPSKGQCVANAKYKYKNNSILKNTNYIPQRPFTLIFPEAVKKPSAAKKIKDCKTEEERDALYFYDIKTSCYPFMHFWKDYGKAQDKDKALEKYRGISETDRAKIKEHVPAYKLSQPDKFYRKNPCTYLNNRSWNNEIVKQAAFPAKPVTTFKPPVNNELPADHYDYKPNA